MGYTLAIANVLCKAACLVAISFSGAAHAQGISIVGTLDCGQWIGARKQDRAVAFEHFLIGLVNGYAVGRSVEIWRGKGLEVSREQFFIWMDIYCQKNPLTTPLRGTLDFADEMTDGEFSRRYHKLK